MNKLLDLKDVTFLIPIRVDGIQRIENLLMSIEHLSLHFKTNIHILEADKYNNYLLKRLVPDNVEVCFIEDYDPIFHRTYYINRMVEHCSTPLVAVWDADVIVSAKQVEEAVDWVRKGQADFVRPYDNKFLDTSMIIRELYLRTRDIRSLHNNHGKMKPLYSPNPVGGGFIANLEKYRESGLENEKFYGWGIEDGERVNRWTILGYAYRNTEGVLYHLSHPRGINSQFHNPQELDIKNGELFRIASMSQRELTEEIDSWGWKK
ncbi:MAG TPA: galactosyltransferase-related protein [Cyclobacteriaceae bacterium]|nr:galactosyltransferase-related protein [Cyclobacteriaceae bacterium]